MGLISKAMAIGRHAYLFPEGLAAMMDNAPGNIVIGETASKTKLPHADDNGWIYVGVIESWDDAIVEEESKTLWAPSPGHLVRDDIVTTKQERTQHIAYFHSIGIRCRIFHRLQQSDFTIQIFCLILRKITQLYVMT